MLVNCYPEIHQGNLSNASIAGTAGLAHFSTVSDDPVRMLHEVDGVLYALAGTTFYEIGSDGTATAKTGSVPAGVSPKADDNGTQIVMPIGDGYVYTIATGAVTQITDLDYNNSSSCAFIGQYISFIEDGTGQFFISAFQDATDLDALDFATGESDPDINIANHQFQGNHWLFGTKTTEVWYLSGEAFPMNPYNNGKYNIGCGARLSVASNEDYICWVTPNRRIYASTGGKPVAISTPEVEYQLGLLFTVNDGVGFIYSEEGHTFYQISFANLTICYDFTTQWWFERTSNYGRHYANHHIYAYGRNLVSDYRSGIIYEMKLDHGSDAGDAIIREGILPPIFLGQTDSLDSVDFIAEMGITPINEPDAHFQLRYAPEGADWRNWVSRTLGAQGQTLKRLNFDSFEAMDSVYLNWRVSVNAPFRLIRADV